MRTVVSQNHWTDSDGNPSGGSTYGNGFAISWQNGVLQKEGVRLEQNGAFVEDIIKAAHGRLNYFQGTKFRCSENANAIYHLEKALELLANRTVRRQGEGTEGTHEGN